MQAGGLAGTAFWMMAAPSYPDYDGFTVYFSSPPTSSGTGGGGTAANISTISTQPEQAPPARAGERTATVIRQHAATVALLNGRPEIASGQLPYLAQPAASLVHPSASGTPAGSISSAPHHLPMPAVGGGHGQVVHSGGSGRGRFCYCYCCCPQM